MKKITRRHFLHQSIAGAAALTIYPKKLLSFNESLKSSRNPEQVLLGKSGIRVSRLALGTGTRGWRYRSNQTALGTKGFVDLSRHAYNSGITFFDVADTYGSHRYLREAFKYIPREKVVILSKIWTRSNDWLEFKGVQAALDRFRKGIGTDYLDIVLLHCQVSPNWTTEMRKACDDLSDAKGKSVILAHGVSCHGIDALKSAAASDWVEILLARINHTGSHMDDTPGKVMRILKKAHDSGKGVVGMKIFGAGDFIKEEQRETSLKYVLESKNIDAMTIGFENTNQIDDTIKRINRILRDKYDPLENSIGTL
jgi:aryl-alcohol dehydrogenase-like predicted oxidoreductase